VVRKCDDTNAVTVRSESHNLDQAPLISGRCLFRGGPMTEAEFLEISCRNGSNKAILERLPELGLSDAWLVSGSLFQTVWNVLTDRALTHGIKDYDIFYFDPDTSWEAEDAVIKQAADLYADLGIEIELKNQARVHLWYEEKHDISYPPLKTSCEGIDRFLAIGNMVAIQPLTGDERRFYVPGLEDMAAMRIRPNRAGNFVKERYNEKCARWQKFWPELTIEAV